MQIKIIDGEIVVPLDQLAAALRNEVQKLREENHPVIANKLESVTRDLIIQAVS